MKISKSELKKIGKEKIWKYLTSAYNAVESMRAYRHLINECLNKKQSNFEDIIQGKLPLLEKERCSFPPGDFINIDGIDMSLHFLVSMFTQAFFQSGRNCLDYFAQIIVEFYDLKNLTYNVDFGTLANRMCSINQDNVWGFVEKIVNAEEYKYLCDYNNLTKHNYDLGISLSVQTDNLEMIGKIPAFSKKIKRDTTRSHEGSDLNNQMKSIHKFIADSFEELSDVLFPWREDSVES